MAFWFWLSWSRQTTKEQSSEGYFNCPKCRRRQPCTLSQIQSGTYLYGFIPLSREPVGPEYYLCHVCQREWQSDVGFTFDFGAHADSPTLNCFKCGKEVPYEKFECPHCGYRLDVGGRF